eukprot:892390-Heterocapsa_arctica.AAC.1
MKWPPAAWIASAHSMDVRMKMFPVVRWSTSLPSSHGKHQGCRRPCTGCGPRPLEYCALDQGLRGGVRKVMS